MLLIKKKNSVIYIDLGWSCFTLKFSRKQLYLTAKINKGSQKTVFQLILRLLPNIGKWEFSKKCFLENEPENVNVNVETV